MPNKCVAFGQSQDQLGQPFNFAFRGAGSYGTALGGYVSLFARIFIWTASIMEIYFCIAKPVTILYTSWSQLNVPNTVEYNIAPVEGFPSFQIYSPGTENYND
jgi:hypothetical protein